MTRTDRMFRVSFQSCIDSPWTHLEQLAGYFGHLYAGADYLLVAS